MTSFRTTLRLALLFLALLVAGPAGAEERKPVPVPDSWFATGVSTVGSRVQFTNYWSAGARFRAESIVAGHRLVSIVNGDTYYSVDDVLAGGVAIRRDPEAVAVDARRDRPFADEWSQLMRAGGESVGREKIQGRDCEIFRLTNSTGRRTVWVSIAEPRVPIRIVTFDRKSAREEVVDYVNWIRGLVIADEFFKPGSQVALLELDYVDYVRRSRIGPVGTVPILYRGFLQAEWGD